MLINHLFMLAQDPILEEKLDRIANLKPSVSEHVGEIVKAAVVHIDTQPLVLSLTVFVLAVFLGFELITKIPPTLHTPLMSGSNAISGITIVGAILATGMGSGFATFLGFLALIMATVNVVGGFLVTHRLLEKFKR